MYKRQLQVTEVDFWRRTVRKERIRNYAIRGMMNVERKIVEIVEGKTLRFYGRVRSTVMEDCRRQ